MPRNTQVWIDTQASQHNLACVRSLAPEAKLMAVVKADAYGHRLDLCVPAMADADLLAVATLEEARAIRRLGIDQGIVLLEGVSHINDLGAVEELDLELVVHHEHQLTMIESLGYSPSHRIWIKVDTGMHRLGFSRVAAADAFARLSGLTGLDALCWLSHFAASESDPSFTAEQIQQFDAAVSDFPGEQCLANSGAILTVPDSHRDWVRAGIVLYGVSPLKDKIGTELGLVPAMRVESELIAINDVEAGESIGYGRRFTADQQMKVGVVAIGYGDGYPRAMRDGAPVLVAGQRCALVGRVSMDMITIDLSQVPEARVGDSVTLWGGALPVEEVAQWADTIPYELVCRMTRRVRYNTSL